MNHFHQETLLFAINEKDQTFRVFRCQQGGIESARIEIITDAIFQRVQLTKTDALKLREALTCFLVSSASGQ